MGGGSAHLVAEALALGAVVEAVVLVLVGIGLHFDFVDMPDLHPALELGVLAFEGALAPSTVGGRALLAPQHHAPLLQVDRGVI